jgi:glycosyltransferase involved in cell wall biosynthesis
MKIVTYLHPWRCLLPSGGVGRHANAIAADLATRPDVTQTLLFSRQCLVSGEAPEAFPLRALPRATHPFPGLAYERLIRLTGFPPADWFGPAADWYYSPMETPLPTAHAANAVTIHDVAPFEPDLPWSDSAENRRMRRSWSLWLPRTLRRADRILTVSEFSKARLVALLGADPERVRVVGNGVDDIFFARGAQPAHKVDEVVVLGGLRYKKGADRILAVAGALQRRGSPLRIVTIGQNEDIYMRRAADCPNVEALGPLPDTAVADRLAGARALLMLSLYEGFGIPPLEAMACGTAAVVSDIGALREAVGEAGLVVDPADPDAVAALLDALRTDTAFHDDQVARGRTHAGAYSWARCTDRVLEALSA